MLKRVGGTNLRAGITSIVLVGSLVGGVAGIAAMGSHLTSESVHFARSTPAATTQNDHDAAATDAS
jgi:hypothetical protein